MSVLIKGMEMPKSCTECGCEQKGFWCGVLEDYTDTKYFDNKRHPNCPLVPVPKHGRLIDAGALPRYTGYALSADEVATAVDYAPTIIPAEEGENCPVCSKVLDLSGVTCPTCGRHWD